MPGRTHGGLFALACALVAFVAACSYGGEEGDAIATTPTQTAPPPSSGPEFSDFTVAEQGTYVAAYRGCRAQIDAGDASPDRAAARDAAEAALPGSGVAAWEGCSDAIAGTPLAGSGIEPSP